MPARLLMLLFLSVALAQSSEIYASEAEPLSKEFRRAKFNYQMFCQGCHAPDGLGHKSVPTLQNTMYRFMQSKSGREYLVRVPGSANSVLNDDELTEVLNWMLVEFSGEKNAGKWTPYQVSEVEEYRRSPLLETQTIRRKLVDSFLVDK